MRTRRSQSSSDPVPSTASNDVGPSEASATEGKHRTVLLHEAVEGLAIQKNDVVVDATLGGAGHARAIAEKLGAKGIFVGFDLDSDAIKRTEEALKPFSAKATKGARTILVQANFRNLAVEIPKLGLTHIDKVLFDLGWSSYQLDAGRGFSFLSDEPLSMTYANPAEAGALTAEKVVNEWAEQSIADVIWGWGEERYSRRIAKAIVEHRAQTPFRTSAELAEVIKAAVPTAYRYGRIHPATRTFQALRIAVNDELGALKEGLRGAWGLLAEGGRIAVVSFHSIEDRLVKQTFLAWEKEGEGERVTKKPLVPSQEELLRNPRARSAKLRVIQKNSPHSADDSPESL